MTTCNKPVLVVNQYFPCQSPKDHIGPCVLATPWAPGPAGKPIDYVPTDLDLHLTDDEIEMLKACTSANEWYQACLTIKKERNGRYPQDWHHRIVESGLMNSIVAKFSQSDQTDQTDQPDESNQTPKTTK